MSQPLQPILPPSHPADLRVPMPPGPAALSVVVTPPSLVASQLAWAGHPVAAALLSGLLALLMLAWYWRVRPGA